jgi:hypothetical protein
VVVVITSISSSSSISLQHLQQRHNITNKINTIESVIKSIVKSCDNILYVLVLQKLDNISNNYNILLEFGPITQKALNNNDKQIISLLNNIDNNSEIISINEYSKYWYFCYYVYGMVSR